MPNAVDPRRRVQGPAAVADQVQPVNGRAPRACEALTTSQVPFSRQTAPSASRSQATPENEWTQVVQKTGVRAVMAAANSSGSGRCRAGRT